MGSAGRRTRESGDGGMEERGDLLYHHEAGEGTCRATNHLGFLRTKHLATSTEASVQFT